jgi:hypothetical protein
MLTLLCDGGDRVSSRSGVASGAVEKLTKGLNEEDGIGESGGDGGDGGSDGNDVDGDDGNNGDDGGRGVAESGGDGGIASFSSSDLHVLVAC